jgi:hypothetical protein
VFESTELVPPRGRLVRDLEFSEIFCKLSGYEHDLRLTKNDVTQFSDVPIDSQANEIPTGSLFLFLTEWFWDIRGNLGTLHDNNIFSALLRQLGHSSRNIISLCERLRTDIYSRNVNINNIFSVLQSTLRDTRHRDPLSSDLPAH